MRRFEEFLKSKTLTHFGTMFNFLREIEMEYWAKIS